MIGLACVTDVTDCFPIDFASRVITLFIFPVDFARPS
jgi:hypothetical protein